MPTHKRQRQKKRERERERNQLALVPRGTVQRSSPCRRQRETVTVQFWIFRRIILVPCPFCQIRASYEVLPELRRELLTAARRVDQHCRSDTNVSLTSDLWLAVIFALLASLFGAALFSQHEVNVPAAVTVCMTFALLVMFCIRQLTPTPSASRIFNKEDLHDLQWSWALFSAGRTALSQVRYGRTHPPALGTAAPGTFAAWCSRLRLAVAAILVNPYAEGGELVELTSDLNRAVTGVTVANVIDASIHESRVSGLGDPGDLLRDLADVCLSLLDHQ